MRPAHTLRLARIAFHLITTIASLTLFFVAGCADTPRSFTFIQMADPQFGMMDAADESARFDAAVNIINATKPDFVVVCGDLVNNASDAAYDDFNKRFAAITVPVHLAPGNHDVSMPVDAAALARYRKYFKNDYTSFDHAGVTFIVVNTQYWNGPATDETQRFDRWLTKTLDDAHRRHRPIIVVGHVPLYVNSIDEADAYFNVPAEKRKQLIGQFQRAGVIAMLCGHTHSMHVNTPANFLLVPAGAVTNDFDKKPGLILWHVIPGQPLRYEFISTLPTPSAPAAATTSPTTSQPTTSAAK